MRLPTPDPAFRWSAEPWGHALRCVPLDAVAQHLFTTRQLPLRPSDTVGSPEAAADAAQRAWTQAAASVGAGLEQVMRVRQVHGRTVRVLKKGLLSPLDVEARPEADALISNAPDVVLAVQVADCVPILMADGRSGAAAAVHAGWRGTAAGIAAEAIRALQREFGTSPKHLTVAVGPSIGPCCYAVGAEIVDAFRSQGATEAELARWFATTDRGELRLDLWAATLDQIRGAGVPDDQTFVARLCTQSHPDVFDSYRAAGARAGRTAAIVRIPTFLGSISRFQGSRFRGSKVRVSVVPWF